MKNKASRPAGYETVRVFISSTFRDMQAERDYLVRFVFPKLREELLRRRIHFVDVDLRWGVTSDQDALELCREVVDECRPRFVCILGGRYGSVPPGKARSITADEVHYGVLDRAFTNRGFAFFYFRDDAATAAMAEASPGEFRELERSENQRKLTELKEAIVAAGLNPFIYQAEWDSGSRAFTGLKQFGDRVYDDLLSSMTADVRLQDRFATADVSELDEFDEETAATEAFVEEHCERFMLGSRATVLEELLAHARATGGNGYLCLTGAPGSGKSALLAHFSQQPALGVESSTILISHFVGVSPGSTDVRRTLRRLCHELKKSCPDLTAEIPDHPETLRLAFQAFLRQACLSRRVVILLDAVNQFDAPPHSAALEWLPEQMPDTARIILSAIASPALEEMRRRACKPREVDLNQLSVSDGEAIIEQFLKRYRKSLEPQQRAALLSKGDAGTPLYLLAALEELRTLGIYEEITRRIAELPSSTAALFAWILERLANDTGFRDPTRRQVGHKLVSHFAAVLGASRYGLSQRELVDLLDVSDPQGNVAALLHLLRPYLMRRGDLLDFYHQQFRATAETAWLRTEEQRQAAHEGLANYFEAQPLGRRMVEELPWQLERAGLWLRLGDTLRDLKFNDAAWRTNRFEVTRYWAAVERHSHRRLVDAFRTLADVPIGAENADLVWNAARLLEDSGHGDHALALWRALIDYASRTGDLPRLAGALGNAGVQLKDRGELKTAAEFLKEQERICRTLGDNYGLQNSLGNQGLIAARQGKLDDAMTLHRLKEAICRAIGHHLGIAAALGNQALLLTEQDPTAALVLHREEMRICSAIGDFGGVGRSLRNQALIYEDKGDFDQALALLGDSERVCSELGNKVELAKCLLDQARIVQQRGNTHAFSDALLKFGQAEAIYRGMGDVEGLATSLHGESRLHIALEHPHDALACLDEAQDLFRQHGNRDGFEACVLNRALVMRGWDEQVALDLLLGQEARLRHSGSNRYLLQCLLCQIPILINQGKLRQALEKSVETEALCRNARDTRRLTLALEYQTKIRERGAADLEH
jgi:nephrocystin-3